MKKVLLAAVAVAFLATSAFAQAQAVKSATAQKAAVSQKAPAKTATATIARGEIEKADAASVTLKVKTKEESFAINAETKILQGTKAITAADLKAGENARVTYTKAGDTMTATRIVVAAAAAAPVKKGK